VIDLDQVSALLQTPADLFGDHDRTVPTAGAADRDLHVPVRGFSEDCADHVHDAVDHRPRAGRVLHPVLDAGVVAVHSPQRGREGTVQELPQVDDDV